MAKAEPSPRPSRSNASSGCAAEFDGVYAAIACALRNTRETHRGPQARTSMTKARVAAVHRKVLAGEAQEGEQEQDIAGRLRRQLGGDGPAE